MDDLIHTKILNSTLFLLRNAILCQVVAIRGFKAKDAGIITMLNSGIMLQGLESTNNCSRNLFHL